MRVLQDGRLNTEFITDKIECCGNCLVHIVVLVASQSTSKRDIALSVGELTILLIKRFVLGVVDGIVRLITRFPVGRVLTGDNRLRQRIAFIVETKLKVLVLDDARVGNLALCIVHHCDALVVLFVKKFRFKAKTTVFESAQLVFIESVDRTTIDHVLGDVRPVSYTHLCGRSDLCSTVKFWTGLEETIDAYVDGVTLDELAAVPEIKVEIEL